MMNKILAVVNKTTGSEIRGDYQQQILNVLEKQNLTVHFVYDMLEGIKASFQEKYLFMMIYDSLPEYGEILSVNPELPVLLTPRFTAYEYKEAIKWASHISSVYAAPPLINSATNLPAIKISHLTVYPHSRRVLIDNEDIHLSKKEYDLLLLLIEHEKRLLTYETIYRHIWVEDQYTDVQINKIWTLIKKLKKKIRGEQFIINKQKVGYIFNTTEN